MNGPRSAPLDDDEIRALIVRHVASEHPHASSAVVLHGPTRIGRYSRIYRAHVPGLASDLAVKCLIDPVTGAPDREIARGQFNALDRVYRAMAPNPSFRVPTPYFVSENEGIMVVEWIAGRPMTDLFLSWGLSLAGARDLMRRAALWLRCFTASNHVSAAPLNIEDKLRGLAAMEQSSLFDQRLARDAIVALRMHADAAGRYDLERSWVHGDFKTDNLLIDDDCTVGIDIHVKHENPVIHDLAAFLNHWELTLYHPLAWRWRPWAPELSRVFLETFDAAYLRHKRLPYLWTALYVLLGNWQEFIERERKTLKHAYVGKCFRSVVRRMTAQLHEAGRHSTM